MIPLELSTGKERDNVDFTFLHDGSIEVFESDDFFVQKDGILVVNVALAVKNISSNIGI